MKIEYDPEARALYIQVKEGEIADTVEIGDNVYADVDEQEETIGVEFLNADKFLAFIEEHNGVLSLPAPVATLVSTKSG